MRDVAHIGVHRLVCVDPIEAWVADIEVHRLVCVDPIEASELGAESDALEAVGWLSAGFGSSS